MNAMTEYYYAKEREESAVERINDSYLEALNSLEKLEAENAKLRESLEYANNEWEKESMEYLSTQDQNAKLRELVSAFYSAMRCYLEIGVWPTDPKGLEGRMRELGVEVD